MAFKTNNFSLIMFDRRRIFVLSSSLFSFWKEKCVSKSIDQIFLKSVHSFIKLTQSKEKNVRTPIQKKGREWICSFILFDTGRSSIDKIFLFFLYHSLLVSGRIFFQLEKYGVKELFLSSYTKYSCWVSVIGMNVIFI